MPDEEQQLRIVRVSSRPPPRFSATTDFVLWMKRFTLYTEEALIPQAKLARELVSLLEDEPFRVVSQLDLASEHLSFQDIVTCLEQHYAPQTNALQWQHQLLNRKQGSDESLTKFAGELRMLADKAYPEFSGESSRISS